ncbi:hypothetical protein ABMA28_008247 [Loxostege sticticalis]|uniref:Reverse transcriptase n=1 Tax=Loxostege sticticalis TaxID=481309 RepID=A0ABD0SIR3_LOXSC
MAAKFGEFNLETGNWNSYCERLDMHFVANNVAEEKKLPTLISIIGESGYELMVNVCSPIKPHKKNYEEVVKLMTEHLQPKPSILAARYIFRQRMQRLGESVTQYVSELKRLSRPCDFKDTLNENLRDQFVCGIRSETIRQRLFAEENLDWTNATKLANIIESAARDASVVFSEETDNRDAGSRSTLARSSIGVGPGAPGDVYRVTGEMDRMRIAECTACGETGHRWSECRYRNFDCSRCRKIGHLRRVCPLGKQISAGRGSGRAGWSSSPRGRGRGRGRERAGAGARGGARAHYVHEEDDSRDSQDAEQQDEEPMYLMSLGNYKPVSIPIKVQNQIIKMEVDTGSALSCISELVYRKMFPKCVLKACNLTLRFYNGMRAKPLGVIEVNVTYNKINKILDLYVIENGTTNLLGRQWLAELNITIPRFSVTNDGSCNKIDSLDTDSILKDMFCRYKEVFNEELGQFTGGRARLRVCEGAKPVFCRARPLPYALRERVDAELDAMLRAGVIEPVDHSDWATPLVIVNKPDGSLRLCADYKVTLNRALLVDKFPVPKIEDLFSKISGSRYFSKLDLAQAYNQIILDNESTKLTVINTHRGLFKYNRLVYGLASSPGIFQRFMNELLKDIPNVSFFLDDILISTSSLSDNVKTLNVVLEVLQNNGLKIKRQKCNFFANEVKYLGFVIDKEGIKVDPDKVKPILTMTPPTNVSELRSFIGMINFYGKFIENLSEHLAPLYCLLRKHSRWVWGQSQQRAFNKVKELLKGAHVLAYYDVAKPVVLTCDAGPRGLGAVLAQRDAAGRERVIAYASRALAPGIRFIFLASQ